MSFCYSTISNLQSFDVEVVEYDETVHGSLVESQPGPSSAAAPCSFSSGPNSESSSGNSTPSSKRKKTNGENSDIRDALTELRGTAKALSSVLGAKNNQGQVHSEVDGCLQISRSRLNDIPHNKRMGVICDLMRVVDLATTDK